MKTGELIAALKKFLTLVIIARKVSHELWNYVKNSETFWERVISWTKAATQWSEADEKSATEIATQITADLEGSSADEKINRFKAIVDQNLSTVAQTAKLHKRIRRVLTKVAQKKSPKEPP